MPAPIDWTAAGGLQAVQTLTVALGPREAARRLNLSDAHAAALRQLCARGKWLSGAEPVTRRPCGVSPQPIQTRPAVTTPSPDAAAALAAIRIKNSIVTNSVTTAKAMQSALAEHRDAGTLSLARAAARNAARAETADLLIETPGDLLSLAKAHAVIHRLDQTSGQSAVGVAIQINIG